MVSRRMTLLPEETGVQTLSLESPARKEEAELAEMERPFSIPAREDAAVAIAIGFACNSLTLGLKLELPARSVLSMLLRIRKVSWGKTKGIRRPLAQFRDPLPKSPVFRGLRCQDLHECSRPSTSFLRPRLRWDRS